MAALSKAGCNLGTCHGNANGKGGFKISLRGEDPAGDYQTLTRDVTSRRINRLSPEQSLLLRKPLMQTPHEGGQRFGSDSPEYQVFRDWIAAGALDDGESAVRVVRLEVEPREAIVEEPNTSVSLTVHAVLSDGRRENVSRWACYEPSQPIVEITPDGRVTRTQSGETTIIVRYLDQQVPVRLAFIRKSEGDWKGPSPRNRIDEIVFAKLKSLHIPAAPLCDDTTFVRRAWLDLCGRFPSAAEARDFVNATDPDKRAKLVDELLERPEFAELWASKWSDLLRNEERTIDRKGVENFHAWLKIQITNDRPWTELAADLLAGRGSSYSEPAANYYRALRDPFTRPRQRLNCFSVSGCNARSATVIRSIAGHRTTTTPGRTRFRGSTTRCSRTTAATETTATSSTANRSSLWRPRGMSPILGRANLASRACSISRSSQSRRPLIGSRNLLTGLSAGTTPILPGLR